jgi:hypothetical protein
MVDSDPLMIVPAPYGDDTCGAAIVPVIPDSEELLHPGTGSPGKIPPGHNVLQSQSWTAAVAGVEIRPTERRTRASPMRIMPVFMERSP